LKIHNFSPFQESPDLCNCKVCKKALSYGRFRGKWEGPFLLSRSNPCRGKKMKRQTVWRIRRSREGLPKRKERGEFEGEQMVAPPDEGKPQVRRGGKSELQRAGWSVIRTAPREMDAYFTGGKESATENIPPAPLSGEF
jgi:hypothetical protein